jgi:predicted DNA-binding transcriptional regulator AlpA
MRELLGELDAPPGSFPLPHPVHGLPDDTPSVIILPLDFWNNHGTEVVDIDAPELHPSAVLVIEDAARAVGLTPDSLMEYVRRGTFPQPPVRLGRTPAWPRPVVQQWLAKRRSPTVPCEGCGAMTQIAGLMAKTSDGLDYTLALCPSCGEQITRMLPGTPHPWTVDLVRRLLKEGPSSG